MTFRLPTFNLLCGIGQPVIPRSQDPALWVARIFNVPCNLAYGRRVQTSPLGVQNNFGEAGGGPTLLLPKLVDIRGPQDITSWDLVEVPQGSGRMYSVNLVDDVGKGFANEHRAAALIACTSWVAPYP